LRVEAVEALANVGGETAIRLLQQSLQDQDNAVQEAANDALARLSKQNQ
jgi:HEAT repeat protein